MLQDLVLLFIGIIVGVMNAIAGGGMLLGFPVLLATGMPALMANATASLISFPGQLTSAYGYREYLKKVPKHYLLLLVPCTIGSAVGAYTLRHTSYAYFERIVPGLILFAVVLFAFQPYLHFHMHKQLTSRKKSTRPPIWFFITLFPLAIYGGYFGAGFGFVILAFLGFTKLHGVHKMNALKNLAAASMAMVTVICLHGTGYIDWQKGLIMAVGTMIGGYTGAMVAKKIPSHALRLTVIGIGLATAGYLFFHTYHL